MSTDWRTLNDDVPIEIDDVLLLLLVVDSQQRHQDISSPSQLLFGTPYDEEEVSPGLFPWDHSIDSCPLTPSLQSDSSNRETPGNLLLPAQLLYS